MVDDRRMKIGVTSPTTLTIPPTPLPLVRSSNCRSRLLARNHPVQEKVVGCEIRCGACAASINGLEWPLAEFVKQRHSVIRRLLLVGCPRRSGQVERHLLFRPSFRLRSRAVAAVVLFVVVMLADYFGRIIGGKSQKILPR